MRASSRILPFRTIQVPRAFPTLRWCQALVETGRLVAAAGAGRATPERLSAWSGRLLSILGIEVEVGGRMPEAQLWVANHLSWLDPVVLMARRPMGTVAKAEVASYPVLGRGAAKAGLRFVDRSDPLSRAAALAAFAGDLRAGRDHLLFPEGTTTRGGLLAPLWTGGLRAAHALGVSVLPVRLECEGDHYPWTGDESLLPHLHTLARCPRTSVRLMPGDRLDRTSAPDFETFLQRVRTHLEPRS